MISKITLIISALLLNTIQLHSQVSEEENNIPRKNAISINLLGTTPLIGITYERLINQKISIEGGFSYNSIGFGTKIFPYKIYENKIAVHFGLNTTFIPFDPNWITVAYIPVGCSIYEKEGFSSGIDLGPSLISLGLFQSTEPEIRFFIWGNIKVGYRF